MQPRVDVAVIGAGHAGLNAIEEIRGKTDRYVLVDGSGLGATRARAGHSPSNLAVRLAEVCDTPAVFNHSGAHCADALRIGPSLSTRHFCELRDPCLDLVLNNTRDEMGGELIRGSARFVDPTTLQVGERTICARSIVIATGASTQVPTAWKAQLGERLLTIESLVEQAELPASIAVVGLDPIGVEIGQALHRLGVQVIGFDEGESIARIQDPEINRVAVEILQRDFPLRLGKPVRLTPEGDRVRVTAGEHESVVDKVFVAGRRRPNLADLGLSRIGCVLDDRGVPIYDRRTLQIGRYPIFIAGDATGGIANLQIAADQGRLAGYNACHEEPRLLECRTPMTIVFTKPNIAMVGAPYSTLQEDGLLVGRRRFDPIRRTLDPGREPGLLKLYADRRSGLLLGGAMVGPRCEHLAHLLACGIHGHMTVQEMSGMPFYHPVIEEALQHCLHQMAKQLAAPTHPSSLLEHVIPWWRRSLQPAPH